VGPALKDPRWRTPKDLVPIDPLLKSVKVKNLNHQVKDLVQVQFSKVNFAVK
jgi:hypothetical protein